MIEEVEFRHVWEQNCNRAWIRYLIESYEICARGAITQNLKDYKTIEFWIDEFTNGTDTTLVVDKDYIVTDGHHRLIAAKLAGVETIKINVCPQRTTYR